jgi:hypothetical protein
MLMQHSLSPAYMIPEIRILPNYDIKGSYNQYRKFSAILQNTKGTFDKAITRR